MTLCNRAQDEFDAFVEFPVVPFAQLFGGKICAALDRQHPRDLFDVKYLLATEGISADVCRGFVYCLLGTDRPMNEVLKPNLQDQSKVMETSFTGMTSEPFSYEDFEKTRLELIETINASLSEDERKLIMSVKNLTPNWDFRDYSAFPSVRWKLFHLEKLNLANPKKHKELADILQAKLWPRP